MKTDYSPLLPRFLRHLRVAAHRGAILDLACGTGRNGLYLIKNGIPLVFADIDPASLTQIQQGLGAEPYSDNAGLATLWPVDFEAPGDTPFGERMFAGILVYCYLHRPLLEGIKRAVYPGGLVVYETFTVDQPQFGRPTNPDFLLRHGELQACFADWDILHSFEGVLERKDGGGSRAIAQIVAQKRDL